MYDSGPALILAGPGSGKTHVLTHHVAKLINSNILPENILVITFTKKAALEMQDRINNLCAYASNRICIGTFHSVFYRLLKRFIKNVPPIISNEKKYELLSELENGYDNIEYLSNLISKYKVTFDKSLFLFASDNEKEDFFKKYSFYEESLKSNNLWDFDDIVSNFYDLILSNVTYLNELRSGFKHILIDEFQDVNELQFEIIRKIAGDNGIVYAVGDENQSIYGFRGATPDIMKKFIESFNNVKVINLLYNYRSKKELVDFSARIIEESPGRISSLKQISIDESFKKCLFLRVSDSPENMFEMLAKDINLTGFKESSACLFRTNKEVYDFKKLLFGKDDTYKSIHKRMIDDIETFIDYSTCTDTVNLKRILRVMGYNIPESIVSKEINIENLCRRFTGTNKGDKLLVLSKKLYLLKNLHPFSFAVYLFKMIISFNRYPDIKEAKKNYEDILEISKECKNLKDLRNRLSESIVKEDAKPDKLKNLKIMTFHQAKGLEFDTVFIPNVYEGKIPSGLALSDCNVEEERRLFYVAVTRARNRLYLYTIKNEESKNVLPSRFIKDLLF